MAKIYDFGPGRGGEPLWDGPSRSRNQAILDELRAKLAADTPEARLLSELRGLEETLLGNHRTYVRLWEAADQLGITPPVRTAAQIVAEADTPEGWSLPPQLTPDGGDPADRSIPSAAEIVAEPGRFLEPDQLRGLRDAHANDNGRKM